MGLRLEFKLGHLLKEQIQLPSEIKQHHLTNKQRQSQLVFKQDKHHKVKILLLLVQMLGQQIKEILRLLLGI